MKLGILTLPLWNNYGGIIQAYALQEILKNYGHEVILLDYHHNITDSQIIKNNLKRFLKYRILKRRDNAYYPNPIENKHISKNTLNFIHSEFNNISKKLFTTKDLENEALKIDGVIVGSDQVWRPGYTPNIRNYFLDFVPDDKIKIAYAASLGTDNWLFKLDEELACKNLIEKFNAVSVREDSAVNIIKEKFNYVSTQVLDPTFLLEKSDYIKLIEKYSSTTQNKGKIFTYILDENSRIKAFVNEISDQFNKKTFGVMPKRFDLNFDNKNQDYIFPPLTEWLKAFNDADYIIADSFHGCVFAIIFNKPFIAIGNMERGLARFTSLLKLFQLENRLITKLDDNSSKILREEIDWEKVNSIKSKLKINSLNFIKDALKNA